MEGQGLASAGVEGGEVRVVGLERVFVFSHAFNHPLFQGIVCNAIESRGVVSLDQLDESSNPLSIGGGNVKFPSITVSVVLGCRVGEESSDLIRDVGELALRVVQAIDNSLGDCNTLSRDSAVLSWLVAGALTHLSLSLLAKSETKGGGLSGSARAR